MKRLLRTAAIVVTGVSLAGGVAAANAGTIGTTGPGSTQSVDNVRSDTRRVTNNTTGRVTNDNPQDATTGHSRVSGNTEGGNAMSGDADNDSLLETTATVNNTNANDNAAMGNGGGTDTGTINNTGPDSDNTVNNETTTEVEVENTTDIVVENTNTQTAGSGNARVRHNTTGGDATSGDASNVSTIRSTLNVTN